MITIPTVQSETSKEMWGCLFIAQKPPKPSITMKKNYKIISKYWRELRNKNNRKKIGNDT